MKQREFPISGEAKIEAVKTTVYGIPFWVEAKNEKTLKAALWKSFFISLYAARANKQLLRLKQLLVDMDNLISQSDQKQS